MNIRHDWKLEELDELYRLPFLELIAKASSIHAQFHERNEVQVCSLISIKTGGCQEDCKYCPQSSRYKTAVKPQGLMPLDEVITAARRALEMGATRVCLGAAWREVRDGKQFDEILKMVRAITDMGVEVCTTLGMLQDHQAKQLAEAGVYAYNHNLDTSRRFYPEVITTRTYDDRLETLDRVQNAGMTVCCGGILGMGETIEDRLMLLQTLSSRNPHPASVPINMLIRIKGTPFENNKEMTLWEMVRTIAVARICMPDAVIRLACGRINFSYEQQALCFLAGANSIFSGEKLLTQANTPVDRDRELFEILGLKIRPAFAKR